MKTHTIDFKNQLTELGRELRGVITYNNTELEEEIYSITPHYNADLLKSVMKQLDIELSVDIPLNTIINCQIGIKVNEQYEMLNYGNYVVYKSEKQEDTNTYKLTCYDKMLYSMKQNEDLGVEYPIKIKDYLIALGNKIGLSVANTTFYNQDMKIPSELYLGQEYTYRDILDEIAQATGSIICLNENDEIQVKYPTQTNDTIDEEYLKDVNVKFGEKYGAINTIVLSRSGESDNVYYPSPLPQNPVEIKIVDNQIMNFNNRSDFLEGIYNALNGLYYYINDFTSTGILYYDVGDLYNVRIGENTYQCLMLNDEINVTTGIEEIIHTDMPEKSETDYSKADKTDMRINKTYLIVDKQNQEIEAVVKQTVDKTNPESTVNKVSRLNIRVGNLESSISDIADITTYGESDRAEVELKDVNESEPIMIKVHPTSTNISYLYPRENLYPSDLQYLPNRIIRFTRTYEEDGTTKTENIDYELPDDLLRYSDTVYDEFYLNYDSQTCQVIKRCAYNADGTVRALGKEITTDYEYPTIVLGEGNYTITLPGYDFGYLYVRLMAKNIYTTQFYTKVETNSQINQKANEINLGVNQKLTGYSTTEEMARVDGDIKDLSANLELKIDKDDNDQVVSMINASADEINLRSNRLIIDSTNFKLNSAGNITATGGTVGGFTLGENQFSANIQLPYTYTTADQQRLKQILLGNIIPTSEDYDKYDFSHDGILNSLDSYWLAKIVYGTEPGIAIFKIDTSKSDRAIQLISSIGDIRASIGIFGSYFENITSINANFNTLGIENDIFMANGNITCVSLTQTSKEEAKKNFEKLPSGLDIIKNIDIYKYNFKNEEDDTKKHIGFVIGDKYKYSEEVTSKNNDGVDVYSFVSVCCKAIQEQQEEIEELKKEIEKLKGGK